MPSRILRESFVTSESVASLAPAVQDRLPRYFLLADDFGCFLVQPAVIRGRIFPLRSDVSAETVESDLADYARVGIMQLYCGNDGKRYAWFPHWSEHQRPPRAGSVRKCPAPPANDGNGQTLPANARLFLPYSEAQSQSQSVTTAGAGGGAVGTRKPPPPPQAPPANARESPPDPPDSEDALAVYLADTWQIPADVSANLAKAWRLKWRALDVLAEVKKARAYEQETGKTHPNSPAGFLRGWLRRTAENPNGALHNGTPAAPLKSARQRAEQTAREADARDRQFREEQARGTDPRALVHRLWLWQRWPQEFPQYAPPEASAG